MSTLQRCCVGFFALGVVLCASALAAPYGKIGEKYTRLGGPAGALGPAIGNETDAPHGGRYHLFRDGVIYWHPEVGEAFAVWGAISRKFWQVGRAEYGYPITDERVTPDGRGRYNHFRAIHLPKKPEASIYWTPETGANAVYGLIRDAWAKGGWERGKLGYPTSDEFQDGVQRRQNFERGYIVWSQARGIQIVESGAAIARPPNSFGAHLLTGMEVAVNGNVLGGDANFLSENTVCSRENMSALTAWLRNKALSKLNPRLSKYGVTVRSDAQLHLHCSFRAEVSRACQNDISLRIVMPRNLFKFWIDIPSDVDPGFSIDFDIEAAATISLPTNSHGQIALGATTAKVSNVKFDSQNAAGDVVLGVMKAANEVHQFFGGEDLLAILRQDRQITFPGVAKAVAELHPALKRIPSTYRIEACVREGNVMRLNGTDAREKGPVLR